MKKTAMHRAIKALVLFFIGAVLYALIEALWRGYTHWTMAVLGGMLFLLIGGINNWIPWDMPLCLQAIIGSLMVTGAELIAGVILNIWLGLGTGIIPRCPLISSGKFARSSLLHGLDYPSLQSCLMIMSGIGCLVRKGQNTNYFEEVAMTNEKKQCLLKYLGYYTGAVDNLWGGKSTQATKDFQVAEGLTPDGVFGVGTLAKALDAVAKGRFKTKDTPSESDAPVTEATPTDVQDATQYLQADGYYHIPRGINVRLSRNLMSREVMCHGVGCCTESIISRDMVEAFQDIRDDYDGPISIGDAGGSGFRCPIHNAAVKGAATSLHLHGDAFDLHADDIPRLRSCVERHITDGEIGSYSWGIHAGKWKRGYVNRFNG